MKIALIYPPSPFQTKETMPPLGIAWLAAVLRQNGFGDVYLTDSVINQYDNAQVTEILKQKGADVIGLSFGTQNRFYAFDLASELKKNFPDVKIVAGGAHPILTSDDIMRNIPDIDIVVRGEGEISFLNLIKALDKKDDLFSVRGISFRRKDGKIIHNPAQEPIRNLDSLPMPARDLLPIEKYQQTIPLTKKTCTSIISSRGCPYHCVYCSTSEQWGHNIRHRSAKNVVDEIDFLMKNYRLDGVGFFDDVLTMDKARVIEICREIINRKLDIAFWCEVRANTIDKEILRWMKAAGCEHISMAIESGSDRILKTIKKAITVEQGIEAAKMIKRAGIKLKIFFMHGLPGETQDDIKKTVFLSRYLLDTVGVDEATQNVTLIYPGTELEKVAKSLGTLDENFSWCRPFEEIRSYPPLGVCARMPIFEQAGLSYEQIFEYVRRAKIAYYLRHPAYALKTFGSNRRNLFKWLSTKVKR